MGLPYFPMYPTDFEAKTSHLTLAEDGAYNRLLRVCWMTPGCTMPADEAWVMRRARAHSEDEKEAVLAILAEFFTIENGRFSNARLSEEWLAANEAHERRKNAGAKGGKAKSLKTKETAPSKAVEKPKQPEPEPEPYIKEDTNVSSQKPGDPAPASEAPEKPPPKTARMPDDWVPSDDDHAYAISKKLNDDEIKEIADEFQAYWADRTDRSGKKSARGWAQCWKTHIRRVAGPTIRNRGVALKAIPGGRDAQGGFASIVAGREASGYYKDDFSEG